ncbi:MAG: FHA domain-containing protein [Gemmataceae bacterium]
MPVVTFQVLEGIDKGRVYRDLHTPVTIGREEGNLLRLNDERVSRFHAKVQYDNGEVIITDLDSTNGTKVNGNVVQIRRLQAGDRVHIGRSLLLYGTEKEIRARADMLGSAGTADNPGIATRPNPATVQAHTLAAGLEEDLALAFNPTDKVTSVGGTLFAGDRPLPPLPQRMSPSQAARLSELLDFLHRNLALATENVISTEETPQVTLAYSDWQRVMAVQMLLARYYRAVTEPDSLEQ